VPELKEWICVARDAFVIGYVMLNVISMVIFRVIAFAALTSSNNDYRHRVADQTAKSLAIAVLGTAVQSTSIS